MFDRIAASQNTAAVNNNCRTVAEEERKTTDGNVLPAQLIHDE